MTAKMLIPCHRKKVHGKVILSGNDPEKITEIFVPLAHITRARPHGRAHY